MGKLPFWLKCSLFGLVPELNKKLWYNSLNFLKFHLKEWVGSAPETFRILKSSLIKKVGIQNLARVPFIKWNQDCKARFIYITCFNVSVSGSVSHLMKLVYLRRKTEIRLVRFTRDLQICLALIYSFRF